MNWTEPTATALEEPSGRSDSSAAGAIGLADGQASRAGIVPSVAMLRGMALLQPLPERVLVDLASRARIEFYGRGEAIVQQGQSRHALFLLVSGKARAVRVGLNQREVLLDVIEGHGAHYGEMSLIDGEPHVATLRCQLPCQVLVVPGTDFQRCIELHPGVAQALMQAMVGRLRQANRRISSLALQDVRERVVTALGDVGEPDEGDWILPRSISRTELASRIGASREMVSRVMKSLMSSGALQTRPDGTLRLRADATALATD